MHNKGNDELIQEALSTRFVSYHKLISMSGYITYPLDSFSILQHFQNCFDDIIGYFLELSFARWFPQTSKYLMLSVLDQLHNVLILSIKHYIIPQLHAPT
jgi:hypothetical protein